MVEAAVEGGRRQRTAVMAWVHGAEVVPIGIGEADRMPRCGSARCGDGQHGGRRQLEHADERRRATRCGESEGECDRFGKNGEKREDAPGIIYMGSERRDRGREGQ